MDEPDGFDMTEWLSRNSKLPERKVILVTTPFPSQQTLIKMMMEEERKFHAVRIMEEPQMNPMDLALTMGTPKLTDKGWEIKPYEGPRGGKKRDKAKAKAAKQSKKRNRK